MRPPDLAPDAPDLASSHFLLRSVDVHDLLSEVEAGHRSVLLSFILYVLYILFILCGFCGVNALELEKRDVGVGVALAALERDVLRAHVESVGGARRSDGVAGAGHCGTGQV